MRSRQKKAEVRDKLTYMVICSLNKQTRNQERNKGRIITNHDRGARDTAQTQGPEFNTQSPPRMQDLMSHLQSYPQEQEVERQRQRQLELQSSSISQSSWTGELQDNETLMLRKKKENKELKKINKHWLSTCMYLIIHVTTRLCKYETYVHT